MSIEFSSPQSSSLSSPPLRTYSSLSSLAVTHSQIPVRPLFKGRTWRLQHPYRFSSSSSTCLCDATGRLRGTDWTHTWHSVKMRLRWRFAAYLIIRMASPPSLILRLALWLPLIPLSASRLDSYQTKPSHPASTSDVIFSRPTVLGSDSPDM